jgi:hypothetical protein
MAQTPSIFPVPLCRYDTEADRTRAVGRQAGIATPRRLIAIDAAASPLHQYQNWHVRNN